MTTEKGFVGKFRFPGKTRGKPVTVIYVSEEWRTKSLAIHRKQGYTIIYPKHFGEKGMPGDHTGTEVS